MLSVDHFAAWLAGELYEPNLRLVVVQTITHVHSLEQLFVLNTLPFKLILHLVICFRMPLQVIAVMVGLEGLLEGKTQTASLTPR